MNSPLDDDLPPKLRAWKVAPQVPAGFQREVWKRIAIRQTARDDAFFPNLQRWVWQQVARPQNVMALLVLSISLGAGIAHVQAQETNARRWKALEVRYAASVDPLAMAR